MLIGCSNSFPSRSEIFAAPLDMIFLTKYGPSQFGLNFPLGSNEMGLAYFNTQSPSLIGLTLTPLLKALAILC